MLILDIKKKRSRMLSLLYFCIGKLFPRNLVPDVPDSPDSENRNLNSICGLSWDLIDLIKVFIREPSFTNIYFT